MKIEKITSDEFKKILASSGNEGNISAKEVARQLRVWRFKYRPNTPLAQLEKETKIPVKRLQKLMLSKDDLPEYTDHILRFLRAFESGDDEALGYLRGEHPLVLPPPHIGKVYTPNVLKAIKSRQTSMTRGISRPYCPIVKQDISARQCIATQNAKDCYGCGSSTRFCAECSYDQIAFSGAELCDFCLSKQLADSSTDALVDDWIVHVSCLLSGGKQIATKTCCRMQGKNCSDCTAITRVCLTCGEKRVRYPEFSMCIRCHVDLFGPDWQAFDTAKIARKEKEREAFFLEQTRVPEETAPEAVIIQQEVNPRVPVPEITEIVAMDPREVKKSEYISLALLQAFSRAWSAIIHQHPEVPPVVLLFVPRTDSTKKNSAQFNPLKWLPQKGSKSKIHEVVIYTDKLVSSGEVMMSVLLHQAAHALNFARRIKDCSKNEYHNRKFRDTAQELGLSVRQVKHYGFAETELQPGIAECYSQVIGDLKEILPHCVDTKANIRQSGTSSATSHPSGNKNRNLKATCQCGFIIRVSRRTLENTTIRCDNCQGVFRVNPS